MIAKEGRIILIPLLLVTFPIVFIDLEVKTIFRLVSRMIIATN